MLFHKGENLGFLLRLRVLCNGEMVELDAVGADEGFEVGVVGDYDGDLQMMLIQSLYE